MREVVFQKELANCLRNEGYWIYKVPDLPAGQMSPGEGGRLRFNLPKACDLLGSDPEGCFVAIECKLQRSGVFTFSDHEIQQRKTLLDIVETRHAARAYFAINFRFEQKRLGRVNEAYLFPILGLERVEKILLENLRSREKSRLWHQLVRVPGGWKTPKGF